MQNTQSDAWNTARKILTMPDRTPKERRDMADIRDIRINGKVDWTGDCATCHFSDGSALMMVLDSDFCPIEFLPIDTADEAEAMEHATSCLSNIGDWDEDELSHNIESNFPNLHADVCDAIARAAIQGAKL